MRFDGNGGGSVNYQPNSFNGPMENRDEIEPPLENEGVIDRHDHRKNNDDYEQAGNLFRILSKDEQERLMDTIAASMVGVPEDIIRRQIYFFRIADDSYGEGIERRLKILS